MSKYTIGSACFIVCQGRADGWDSADTGRLLQKYDPEYNGGQGRAWWTPDPAQAMRFENVVEALNLWRTVSKTRPTRPDGNPNRPLTAYSITFERAD